MAFSKKLLSQVQAAADEAAIEIIAAYAPRTHDVPPAQWTEEERATVHQALAQAEYIKKKLHSVLTPAKEARSVPILSSIWARMETERQKKETRDGRPWNWADICRATGVPEGNLWAWKKGGGMRLEAAVRFGAFFEIDPNVLRFGNDQGLSAFNLSSVIGRLDYLMHRRSIEQLEDLKWKGICRKLGLQPTLLSQVRKGGRELSEAQAIKLGEFFDASANWILDGDV